MVVINSEVEEMGVIVLLVASKSMVLIIDFVIMLDKGVFNALVTNVKDVKLVTICKLTTVKLAMQLYLVALPVLTVQIV